MASGVDEGGGFGGSGFGGGNSASPPPVTVVHQETFGPYESVTLHSTVPGALYDWLTSHGYAVPDDIQPVIDAYESEGFDFLALRLIPGESTRNMKPVRVTTPGASPVLPLRMVAAGVGAKVGLTLFVIGEGRWDTSNFPVTTVNMNQVVWDYDTSSSDYATVRNKVLEEGDGRSWINAYSQPNTMFQSYVPATIGAAVSYSTSNGNVATSISSLYAQQAAANNEATNVFECMTAFQTYGSSPDKVVDVCAKGVPPDGGAGGGGANTGGAGGGGANAGGANAGGAGGAGGAPANTCTGVAELGEIDSRELDCDGADDLAVALIGMHPNSVWITRLESNLPRAALTEDLVLEAGVQLPVDNWFIARQSVGDPCPDTGVAPLGKSPPPPRPNPQWWFVALAASGVVIGALRRAARPKRVMA